MSMMGLKVVVSGDLEDCGFECNLILASQVKKPYSVLSNAQLKMPISNPQPILVHGQANHTVQSHRKPVAPHKIKCMAL